MGCIFSIGLIIICAIVLSVKVEDSVESYVMDCKE